MRTAPTAIAALLIVVVLSVGFAGSNGIADEHERISNASPEALFRTAMSEWQASSSSSSSSSRQQQQWQPWSKFAEELEQLVVSHDEKDQQDPTSDDHNRRLEIVGAYEEGILAIERAIHQQGLGDDDVPRDMALSQLYCGYASLLSQLSARECKDLALDPHTLLIGADTISTQQSEASTITLCIENAENSLRNAVTLDATNTQAQELLDSILGNGDGGDNNGDSMIHKRKPKEFVAELFDSFADTFDEKLVQNLEYKVPQMVGDLAKKMIPVLRSSSSVNHRDHYTAILDAGCGTGLAGRHLRPLLLLSSNDGGGDDDEDDGIMIGVDASQKMLDKAALCTRSSGCGLAPSKEDADRRPLYDKLLDMDLEDMTIGNTLGTVATTLSKKNHAAGNGFDLVVAADVLVYFGNLANIIKVFASISIPGALLIFSTEKPASDEQAPLGWRLLPSGRFAHTKQHAVDVATRHGYKLVSYEEIVPRMEKGEPVRGQLFAFSLLHKRNDDDDVNDKEDNQRGGNEEL